MTQQTKEAIEDINETLKRKEKLQEEANELLSKILRELREGNK